MYLGSPQITNSFDAFDWFLGECYWTGLNEAPSATREDFRGALRYIKGDSPFTQPPLMVVESRLQVADKQRRLAVHDYDGHVVHVEG